jgi:hypothetical protein
VVPIYDERVSPYLRGIESRDVPFLYFLVAEYPESWPRLCDKGPSTPQQFEFKLHDGVLAQFLVEVEVNGERIPIGLVGLHRADHLSGVVWVESVGLPGDHHEAVRDRALADLIDRAFSAWRFRRVCGTHHGFERPVFANVGDVPVREEVRLENVFLHEGMYWDRVFSVITREDWLGRQETVAR